MKYIRQDKFTKPYSPADALNLALAKEESSYNFYRELIKETKNEILVRLLIELRDAELGHIKKIKAMFAQTK